MNNNIFEQLLIQLVKKQKSPVFLDIIFSVSENFEEVNSIFGKEKIDSLMESSNLSEHLNNFFNIVFNLMNYKYKYCHIPVGKKNIKKLKSNLTEDKDKEATVLKIDKVIIFMLNLILQNKENYKNNTNYGNKLVQLALNQYLPKEIYKKIFSIKSELETDKNLLEHIFWLNMPLGSSTKIITQKMSDSWTIRNLLDITDNNNSVKFKPGAVFYELLSMKLNSEKMKLSDINNFVKNCQCSSFFNSKSPDVYIFLQNLVFKIKSHLTDDEKEIMHQQFKNKKMNFGMELVLHMSFLKEINKEKMIGIISSSLKCQRKNLGMQIVKNLMPIYVDTGEVISINDIIQSKFLNLLNFKSVLIELGLNLTQEDLILWILQNNFEDSNLFIKSWALEVSLENNIPINKNFKCGKVLKF